MTEWSIHNGDNLVRFQAFLAGMEPPYTITVKKGEESRRDRQNRFSFEAYKQVAMMLGDRTPADVRAESKLHVAIPIMREDDNFRALYDEMIRPLPYEHKLAMMVEPFDFAVTRSMNVKQMTRYISELLAYWDKQGAPCMMPDNL